MSTVIPFQSSIPPLTQAHRDAMAYIQDLAITITLQGVYSVSAEYTGVGHRFCVNVLLFSRIDQKDFKTRQLFDLALPGRYDCLGQDALEKLQAIAREIESLLTPPEGGDAA